mmetsp:Transcript_3265/g.8013  ORF Transcript_3265/g.8013 Transcript_3265/m.8013 type:complete len:206 (-) Transcript_3265:1635-2252(-)
MRLLQLLLLRALCLVRLDELHLLARVDWRVVVKLHSELAFTLRSLSKFGRVAKHLAQRHLRHKRAVPFLRLRVDDSTPLFVDPPHDCALVLFWHADLHLHDGLQHLRLGLSHGLPHRPEPGRFESHLARVDGVLCAILQRESYPLHWTACERAFDARLKETLLDGRHVAFRDVVAHCLVHKLAGLPIVLGVAFAIIVLVGRDWLD